MHNASTTSAAGIAGLFGGSSAGSVSPVAATAASGDHHRSLHPKVSITDPYSDRLLVSVAAKKSGDLDMLLTQLTNAVHLDDVAIESMILTECERHTASLDAKLFYPRLSADLLLSAARDCSGSIDALIDDVSFLVGEAKRLLRASSQGSSRLAVRLSSPLPPGLARGGNGDDDWSRAVLAAVHCLGYVERHTDGQRQWLLDSSAMLDASTLARLTADLLLLAAELGKQQRVKRGLESPLAAVAAAADGRVAAATLARTPTVPASRDCHLCGQPATMLCRGGDGCDNQGLCSSCSAKFHSHWKRSHHLTDGSCMPLAASWQAVATVATASVSTAGSAAPLPSRASSQPLPAVAGSSASLPTTDGGGSRASGGGTGSGSLSSSDYIRSAASSQHPETARGRRLVKQLEVDLQELREHTHAIKDPVERQHEIDRQLEQIEARLGQLTLRQQSGEVLLTGTHQELIACHSKKDLLEEERRACARLLPLGASEASPRLSVAEAAAAAAVSAAPLGSQRSLSAGAVRSAAPFGLSAPAARQQLQQQQGLRSSVFSPPTAPQACTYADIVEQLRSAERAGVHADLIADALRQMQNERGIGAGRGGKVAIANWPLFIARICEEAQRADRVAAAGLTPKEVCRAAATCRLDVGRTTEQCVAQRQQLVSEVRALTSADAAAIASCLREQAAAVAADGGLADVTASAVALRAGAAVLEPFRQRIWQRQLERVDGGVTVAAGGSPPLSRSVHDVLSDRGGELARRARVALAEGGLQSWMRALNALDIVDKHPPGAFALTDVLQAVHSCGGMRASLSYLQQECVTCLSTLPRSRVHELTCQTCKVCSECLVQHFTIKIRERPVFDFVCPGCGEPNSNAERTRWSDHFEFLGLILQSHLPADLLEAYQRKLRDWFLMNDPKFCWCTHCSSGFVYDGDPRRQPRTTCPDCQQSMCFSCRKPWEAQHEGLTCERFAQWKADNDPRMQAEGVAKNLEENGINCPKCQFRFLLAKGGCMHFTCTQCKHQFCAGCRHDFSHSCRKLPDCSKRGLHCHHPRNCLYYMRDSSIQQLQQLLQAKGVEYKHELTAQQAEALRSGGDGASLVCRVMEQKEQASGLRDETCGKPATEAQAGLCEVHYKEYLVHLINKACIDPIVHMDGKELETVLVREGLPVPKQKDKQKKELYVAELRSHVSQVLPLLLLGNVKY